jgi:flagellar hook assembly protein FlgD
VAIVDSHEQIVRTLDSDVALGRHESVTYVWDGRNDAGDFAPAGRYRLRVDLPDADREMIWPRRFTVVEAPPEP